MTDGGGQAPVLVLGPLLRYVGETAATIWAETDRACRVQILGRETATFEVAGHHYALAVAGHPVPGQRDPDSGPGAVAADGVRLLPDRRAEPAPPLAGPAPARPRS